MKKLMVTMTIFTLLASVGFVMALPKSPADFNGLDKGKSSVNHLYLYEKYSGNWSIVPNGAWGKLTFKDKFVFNGHGLDSGDNYTLIRYTDPWPGTLLTCLGYDVASGEGNVHISGDWAGGGSKVWLVLSSDVNCDAGMFGWNPTEYLFEYNTISF